MLLSEDMQSFWEANQVIFRAVGLLIQDELKNSFEAHFRSDYRNGIISVVAFALFASFVLLF